MRLTLLFGAALALTACSDSGGILAPTAMFLNGTWAEENEVPGSSEIWTLSVSGAQVSGTGTWSGEACCGGTVRITGHIHADTIYLGLKRTGSPVIPADSTIQVTAVLRPSFELALVPPIPGNEETRFRKQR